MSLRMSPFLTPFALDYRDSILSKVYILLKYLSAEKSYSELFNISAETRATVIIRPGGLPFSYWAQKRHALTNTPEGSNLLRRLTSPAVARKQKRTN